MENRTKYIDLGLREYKEVWQLQETLFEENLLAKRENTPTRNSLILCEHPHTITIGKNGNKENLLFGETYLKDKGVSIFNIDRGGDVTYHGPGQLVAYPIFDLETFHIGLRQYIELLEVVMIRLLALYGVKATPNAGATGVWIDVDKPKIARKIGAIGVRSSRFVTMHGFALNINTDLSYFSLINPCGFVDKGVTSLAQETGTKLEMETIKEQVKQLFSEVFYTQIS